MQLKKIIAGIVASAIAATSVTITSLIVSAADSSEPIKISLSGNVVNEDTGPLMIPTGSLTLSDIKKIVAEVQPNGGGGIIGANIDGTWANTDGQSSNTWTWELTGTLTDGLQIQKWWGDSITVDSVKFYNASDVLLAVAELDTSLKNIEIPFEKKDYTLTVIDASGWGNSYTKAAQLNLPLSEAEGITFGTTTYADLKKSVYSLTGVDWSAYDLPEGVEASNISVNLYAVFTAPSWYNQYSTTMNFTAATGISDDAVIQELGMQLTINGDVAGIDDMTLGDTVVLSLATTEPVTTAPETEPGTTAPETEPGTTAPETEPGTTAPETEPGTTEPDVTEPETTAPETEPGDDKSVEIPFEKKDYTLTVIDASGWGNPDFTKAAQVNLALTDVKGVTIGTTTYGEMKDKVYKLSGIDWSAYNLPEGLEASDISVTLYSQFGEKWVWCSQNAPEIDFTKSFDGVTDDMAIMALGIQINVNGNKGGIEDMDIGAEVKLPLSGSSNPDPDPDTTTTTEDEPIYTWPAQSEAPTTTSAETEAPATTPAETEAPETTPAETEAPTTVPSETEPAGTTQPDVVIPGTSEIIEGSDEGSADVAEDNAVKIEISELNVTIEANAGTFEENVSKIIAEVAVKLADASESEKAAVIAAAIEGLANASESVSVNDVISVTLKDQDGNIVQPINGTTVKVTLPYDGKSNYAVYIDGTVPEFIKLTIADGYASFEAKHFSDYYLVTLSDEAINALEGGNAAGDPTKPSDGGDKNIPTGFTIAFIPAAAAAIAVVASKRKKH